MTRLRFAPIRLTVNFFGHAVVASAISDAPLFALGAMLPDFEGMLGLPSAIFGAADVDRGRRCHHLTDAVFHSDRFFLEHQAAAQTWLRDTRLGRGQRRAVAHVGVELVLDAALCTPNRLHAYRAALLSGLTASEKSEPFYRLKLSTLLATLLARSKHAVALEPDAVAPRLQRALSQRPALRLCEADLPTVNAWTHAAWRPIHEQADEWLQCLVAQVRDATFASPSPLADRD